MGCPISLYFPCSTLYSAKVFVNLLRRRYLMAKKVAKKKTGKKK